MPPVNAFSKVKVEEKLMNTLKNDEDARQAVSSTMVNYDLLENKTEMMLNGDIMFRLQKKVATVLSPPPELVGKQT